MATALADRELASHLFASGNPSNLLLTASGILQQLCLPMIIGTFMYMETTPCHPFPDALQLSTKYSK
jgi:hypothetical protein